MFPKQFGRQNGPEVDQVIETFIVLGRVRVRGKHLWLGGVKKKS